MSMTKVTSGIIDTLDASKITGTMPAIDGSNLTGIDALPAAGTSGNVLTSDGANWSSGAAPAGGKVKQWKQVVNTSGLVTTSTTMADIPGCTITLNDLVIGNIIEISAQVPIRKSSGILTHPGVGVLKDGVMLDNVTWGIGVSMQAADIWITREPYITCINATATSHTFQLQGNVNYGTQICFGGELSGTTYPYVRIRMIVREISV